MDLIESNDKTKRLLNEVVEVFGKVSIWPTQGHVSSYQLNLFLDQSRPKVVWPMRTKPSISVAVGTGRELEAAAHELLHLKLGAVGYANGMRNWRMLTSFFSGLKGWLATAGTESGQEVAKRI